jgi:hypothetical protein
LEARQSGVQTTIMSTLKDDLLRAMEPALAGEWDAAHNLVQQHEDAAKIAWTHAMPHNLEGDLTNSRD